MTTATASSTFVRILWIKPSHYDDDGYVVQWWHSSLPAKSLATVCGIALDSIGAF